VASATIIFIFATSMATMHPTAKSGKSSATRRLEDGEVLAGVAS
jgi:hypothetical protein